MRNLSYVITGIDGNREAFITFYKSNEVSSVARPTHSEEARAATDNTSSTGKVTQISDNDQTNPQQSATEQGKNSYSLPLQPANDPALTPEQASLLSPENLLKAGENVVLDINSTSETLPLLSVAGEDGARLTSYGRLNERRRKEGLQLDFDIQGNLVSYGLYHDGHREGMHYTFNAFGEKLSEGEFRNGTPVGTHRLWRDYDMISGYNGKDHDRHASIIRERTDKHPYLVVNYNEQGKRQGDSWRYDENGKPMTRSIWNNGRRVAEWYDKGYIQQVVNHPEEYDTSADAALWRRRMARKHGSTPWIPLGQPGAGQPYKPAEQTGTDSYSLPEDRTLPEEPGYPLRDFITDPLAHVRDNLRRIAEREEGDRPLDWTDPYEAFRRPCTAALELSRMTDAEFLERTRTAEAGTYDWNFFNDKYDRRHRQEYADLTDHYRAILEQTQPTLNDAYAMLAAADQHFHYGGHTRAERPELLAQRDVLQDYIDRKEAVFQIQKTNISE